MRFRRCSPFVQSYCASCFPLTFDQDTEQAARTQPMCGRCSRRRYQHVSFKISVADSPFHLFQRAQMVAFRGHGRLCFHFRQEEISGVIWSGFPTHLLSSFLLAQ